MKRKDRITRIDAAAIIGVTPKTLANWEKQGKIPPPERDFRGWRLYDPAKLADIKKRLIGSEEESQARLDVSDIEISARNRLFGTIIKIDGDSMLVELVLKLPDGQEITSVITRGSVKRLGLRVGDRVSAFFKATDVIIAR